MLWLILGKRAPGYLKAVDNMKRRRGYPPRNASEYHKDFMLNIT